MVATTFGGRHAPRGVGHGLPHGVAGNWLWWNAVASGMLTVFFFAALWRRAGVMTDVELVEIRYGGQGRRGLRGFRAAYLALPINCIILGWVNLAMAKILGLTLGLGRDSAVARVPRAHGALRLACRASGACWSPTCAVRRDDRP
jgi:SSS family solute:Na+ symporter